MFELSIEQIKMVSGGGSDSSGNNYGDSSKSTTPSYPVATTALTTLGGLVGGRVCGEGCMIVGSTAGGYLGHRIDNMDWNELGENYKNNIDQ
ncbi:hypothetical protein [Moraxella catarrhalis]|uniref:hypothetical protein n=1 Tax=Moraxella catarrhalis TaxID=480 RepID=UPI0007E34EC0|nr:hypothetical protein [Moraxella catarrhalis]